MGHYSEFYSQRNDKALVDAYYTGPDNPTEAYTDHQLKVMLAEGYAAEKELRELKASLRALKRAAKI